MQIETSREPAETLTMGDLVVERFPVGKHRANAYIVYGESSRRGVVIDPGAEGEVLTARIDSRGLDIRSILLTHGHWDHVGAADVVAAHTRAAVHIHPHDVALLQAAPIYAFRIDGLRCRVPSVVNVEDAAAVALDDEPTLVTHHIPGHTEGGVAYRLGQALFTGDTLLPAGASRFDLPGGDAGKLRDSLATLSRDLKADDVICPGHGRFWASAAARVWLDGQLETA